MLVVVKDVISYSLDRCEHQEHGFLSMNADMRIFMCAWCVGFHLSFLCKFSSILAVLDFNLCFLCRFLP